MNESETYSTSFNFSIETLTRSVFSIVNKKSEIENLEKYFSIYFRHNLLTMAATVTKSLVSPSQNSVQSKRKQVNELWKSIKNTASFLRFTKFWHFVDNTKFGSPTIDSWQCCLFCRFGHISSRHSQGYLFIE